MKDIAAARRKPRMRMPRPPTEDELEQLALENIIAKARNYELWHHVRTIRLTLVDRIFFAGSRDLGDAMRELVRFDRFQPSLVSTSHKKVYDVFPMLGRRIPLRSFREAKRPSLQVIYAVDPSHEELFGEMDIDLSSPKMDVWGFFVHLVEVLAPGKTDHRRIRKALLKDPDTRRYL